jgi:hypothetical protein
MSGRYGNAKKTRSVHKKRNPGLEGDSSPGTKRLNGLRHPLREEKRETILRSSLFMIAAWTKRFPIIAIGKEWTDL